MIATIPVTQRPLTIGRATECTLALPSTAVSRKHASVYLDRDGSVVINDEGSANGVQVNGSYISAPTRLSEGCRIQISDFTFHIEAEAPGRAEAGTPRREPVVEDDGVEREELETVLEAQIGAGTLLASSSIQLVGRGGPFDGTTFTLDKPLLSVGRVEGNEVVVDDPSISRRHAQIRLSATGDRFTVLDLRSSNGTFVDGERVKRSECSDGTIVRFGDIAFKVRLVRQAEAKKPRRRLGRRTLMIGALAVLLLLVTVGIIAKLKQPKPPPPRKISAEERLRQIQAKVQRLVDEGKRRLAQRQWSEAIQAFDKAQQEDPLNKEAQTLRDNALTELKHMQVYEKGQEFYGLGNKENLEKAKETFLHIPSSSVYHREVRYKLRTINERLAEGYRIEGVSRCKARYWGQCHEALCKFFELLPEGKVVPGESRLRRQLQRVERRLTKRRGFVPCEARRFIHPQGEEAQGETPEEVLAGRYEDKRIRTVILAYFNGKIEHALKMLHRLTRDKRMRPHWATLREMNRQLLIIRGKYQEGFSAHRERNAEEAAKEWGMVLTADSSLIPTQIESFYRREVKRALGDLYFELGNDEFKVLRYPQAYALWIKGKHFNDAHERILNGLLQLDAVAERLVREAGQLAGSGRIADAREKLETAKKITEENRPVHQQALREMEKL